MRLGEILVKRELVTPAAISEALERQKTNGGRLGANLIALGYLTEEQLSSVIHGAPAAPNGPSATGISPRNLLSLLLKFMSVEGCETVLDLANRIKLPRLVVQQLFDEATQQKLVQATGASSSLGLSMRYALTETGRNAAKEAFDQNLYLGPAPVSLAAYTEQTKSSGLRTSCWTPIPYDATSRASSFQKIISANCCPRCVPGEACCSLALPAMVRRRSPLGSPRSSRTRCTSRMRSRSLARSSRFSTRPCISPEKPRRRQPVHRPSVFSDPVPTSAGCLVPGQSRLPVANLLWRCSIFNTARM